MHDGRVIVIGSGPTGAVAARALVADGVPVTMLESGSTPPHGLLLRAHGRNLFRHGPEAVSNPQTFECSGHPGTSWFRYLQPGGLSNQWTGAVPRFSPLDFCDGERLHQRYRWPVTYDELEPYYAEVEGLLQVSASPQDVPGLRAGRITHERWLPKEWNALADVARRHGQGLTALPLAEGPDWLITQRRTAFNSFSSLVSPLAGDRRFELRLGAHALRLEWSGARRGIAAVIYYDRVSGRERRIDAAAVVLACGPLGSTKLLFDSACPDFPDGLGNTEGLVGRYLHDHPKEWWTFSTSRPLRRLGTGGYLTRRPHEASPPLMATSWTLGNASGRERALSLVTSSTHSIGVQVFGSMVPSDQHFVRPSPSQSDEFGLPKLELHIEFDEDVVRNVVDARQHLMGLMGEAGYDCTLGPVEPQLVPGFSVHFGGTARMHRDREHGVLDEWNRPFDIGNLAVVDASCFTTTPEKNPTLTAMALSLRAVRRLAHDLKRG